MSIWGFGFVLFGDFLDKHFPNSPNFIENFYLFLMVITGVLIFWLSLHEISLKEYRDFIKNFSINKTFESIKEIFNNLMIWAPIILTYIVAPLILVTYIGAWVFLIFPIWAIGIYIFAERSARKREHMPMLEHTEAIGIMMFVFFPTLLSFIGTLIYYLLVVNEHTSKVLY